MYDAPKSNRTSHQAPFLEAASNLRPEVHGDLLIVARAKTIKIVAPERLPKDNTKMADVFRCRM